MPIDPSARIHPTAVISPEADLGPEVQVGPHVVIDGKVSIGSGCVLHAGAHLIGSLTLGPDNVVFNHAVLGSAPQHLKYAGEPTRLEIGARNLFRENVTVHRGTTASGVTRIGSHNFFMAGSHVAHDCVIGHGCILANGALMGGHCILQDGAYLSGNCAVHQFARIGRLALLSGVSATTKDIPPFIIMQRINCIVGVNVIGMRRAGINSPAIDAVRRAFHLLYREGLVLPQALSRIEQELSSVAEVAEFVAFIRESTRGISLEHHREAA